MCTLKEKHNQFILEDLEDISPSSFYTRRQKYSSWTKRPKGTADSNTWHLRLGHLGPDALNHLVGHSEGVKIKGPSTVECDACACSKIKRQNRRSARKLPDRPGIRLAIDFHDLEEDSLGYTSVMLVTDRYSGLIWDFYLTNRRAETIINVFIWLFQIFQTQYHTKPEVIEMDNEIPMSNKLQTFLSQQRGIRLEPSAPNTQAQNGAAERSGGVIKEKARAMRYGSKLPSFLWSEIIRAAVYLHNRTPRYIYNWMSPYERFFTFLAFRDGVVVKDRKPAQQHLKAYGCKAYAMTSDAQLKKNRKQRLNPRAFIGYLVGYNSTNIYRIWNPVTNRVISTRDVLFNESEFFIGDIQQMRDDLLHITTEEMEALLLSVQAVQTDEQGSIAHFEDEELYIINRAETEDLSEDNDNPASSILDTEILPPSSIEASRYLTPEESIPDCPRALLAMAICNADPLSAGIPGPDLEPDMVQEQSWSTNTKYGVWRTAFNTGRLVQPLCTSRKTSKATLARIARGKTNSQVAFCQTTCQVPNVAAHSALAGLGRVPTNTESIGSDSVPLNTESSPASNRRRRARPRARRGPDGRPPGQQGQAELRRQHQPRAQDPGRRRWPCWPRRSRTPPTTPRRCAGSRARCGRRRGGTNLVQDLITLSRIQAVEPVPDPRPVDLDTVVAEAVDRCRMKANARGITLTSIGSRGLSVLGDDDLLITALRNLLENAVAYSPERTRVVISTRGPAKAAPS